MKLIPLVIRNIGEIKKNMKDIGVSSQGVEIMAPKGIFKVFKVEEISSPAANIIKQYMLSLGSDAAIPKDAFFRRKKFSLLIFGTTYQLKKLAEKLNSQPFGLSDLSKKLTDNFLKQTEPHLSFRARGRVLNMDEPIVCGILNVTPDSFSGDGLLKNNITESELKNLVFKRIESMISKGAKIIDIGGESSRPYSKPIKEDEEIRRVIPVLKMVRKEFPKVFLSIDTYKYKVAKEAVDEGVDIINDITALRKSPQMVSLISKYNLGCILMHMKGTPRTMQNNPQYKDVVEEIFEFLEKRVNFCLKNGINKEQIMVDPGIGFGKSVDDNLKIINKLYIFKSLGLPIFLGISRKSFIGKILNVDIDKRLIGSISALVVSLINGANVFRVHDVEETCQTLRLVYSILRVN
ncbi:MAG: dihydropteroate synthase [Candidatus Omnitrophica bacterium]|nr:dihydropteroate synthase [Candidatus Omnitrophota bacterium]